MSDVTEANLPWDLLWETEGEIPWDALEEIAGAVAEDESVLGRLQEVYESAWTNAQSQETYADFYVAAVTAMAAARTDDDVRRRMGSFLLDKLLQAAEICDDVAVQTLMTACGAQGPAILPRVMDSLDRISTDHEAWLHLWELTRLAAKSEDEHMRQRVIQKSRGLLQKVEQGERAALDAIGAAWALVDLDHTDSLPLLKRLSNQTYGQESGGGDMAEAAKCLAGQPECGASPPCWKSPVTEWLPKALKDAKMWYRGEPVEADLGYGSIQQFGPVQRESPKVGRNDPCPCGSGKKYKKCCQPQKMQKDRRKIRERRRHEKESEAGENGVHPPTSPELAPSDDTRPNAQEAEEIDSLPERSDSPYPQLDLTLPEITGEEEALVDRWWDDFDRVFRKHDAEGMLRRIESFMEEHPDLFVQLCLDEGGLFELGGELARRGRHARYAELLRRIRREHPEVYVRSYGFFDLAVITDLVVSGRRKEVPEYFDYFERYPDSFPDQLEDVLDVLAATNCQEAVFELARTTAVQNARSPLVMNEFFVVKWLIFENWIPFLNDGNSAERATRELYEKLTDLDISDGIQFEPEWTAESLRAARHTFSAQDLRRLIKEKDLPGFYEMVCWNFTGFLCRQKGMSWAAARFYADQLERYLTHYWKEFSPEQPFAFHQERMDEYIGTACRFFRWIEGVPAMSLLQAVYEFAGYLEALSLISAPRGDAIREVCLNLEEECREVLEASDPAVRIFADFPEYPWC